MNQVFLWVLIKYIRRRISLTQPELKRIKSFFSDKRISLLILLTSVAGRTIQLIFFHNVRVDRSFQLMAMQNMVEGHGVTLAHVTPPDLSTIIYEPLIKWPPGYSILISPFYLLFNKDYVLASLLAEILFSIVLIVICRRILIILETPVHLVNLFTLLSGFFIYDFYVITNTDAIGTTFFILAVYISLLLLKNENTWIRKVILLTIVLFMCGLIKYLFMPVIFIPPTFIFLYGVLKGSRVLKKAGLLVFFLLAICICSLLIYQKTVSGSATYISQTERGFFPENLLHFYPFLPASLVKPETVQLAFDVSAVPVLFQIIHLLLFLLIIGIFLFSLRRYKFQNISLRQNFFYLSVLLIGGICLVLAFLSVTVAKEEHFPGVFWTYVQEARYYGPAIMLTQLSALAFFQFGTRTKYLKYVFTFLIFLFCIEIVHGMLFSAKRIVRFNKEEYSWQYEDKFQKYADSILKSQQNIFSAKKAVITGSSYYMNHRVSLYSHVPILSEARSVNNPGILRTKEPILLLVILNKNDLTAFQTFLSSGRKLAGQFRDFYFYAVYVEPN